MRCMPTRSMRRVPDDCDNDACTRTPATVGGGTPIFTAEIGALAASGYKAYSKMDVSYGIGAAKRTTWWQRISRTRKGPKLLRPQRNWVGTPASG